MVVRHNWRLTRYLFRDNGSAIIWKK